MASFVERLWAPEEHGQLSRRDRAPGRYLAYVPDELGAKLPRVGDEARAATEDASGGACARGERPPSHPLREHLLVMDRRQPCQPKRLAIAEVLEDGGLRPRLHWT